MPDLWCSPCEQNHPFTDGEAERVVYALVAEAAKRTASDPEDVDYDDDALCLEVLFTSSLETEGHRVAVSYAVERRREFERRHGKQQARGEGTR